jgi:hypothetical protein
MMANAKRPTERSRHVDIQNFALQKWVQKNDVLLEHVRGTINPSDALTKALGWILHHRNCSRVMGMMPPLHNDLWPLHRRLIVQFTIFFLCDSSDCTLHNKARSLWRSFPFTLHSLHTSSTSHYPSA